MKKIFLLATVISLMAFSCEKEGNCIAPAGTTCKVNNPASDLVWLKAEIQRREQNGSGVEKYFTFSRLITTDKLFLFTTTAALCAIP